MSKEVTEPGSFMHCLLFEFYLVRIFSCTVLFVSISQIIGCEDASGLKKPRLSQVGRYTLL